MCSRSRASRSACRRRRGWPLPRVQALLAAGLLLLSARVPLSAWAQPGTDDHSPFLLAVERLQLWFGTSTGDLVVATAAALLSVAAALGPWRPRLATAGSPRRVDRGRGSVACRRDRARPRELAPHLLHRYLPAERSWVDAAHVGHATLVEAAGNRPSDGEEQLFWNRSLRRVAVLPGGSPPDRLASRTSRSTRTACCTTAAGRCTEPLVVDGYASTVELRDARVVASAPRDRLVVPHGVARLRLYVIGRSTDGLLWSRGASFSGPTARGARRAGEWQGRPRGRAPGAGQRSCACRSAPEARGRSTSPPRSADSPVDDCSEATWGSTLRCRGASLRLKPPAC